MCKEINKLQKESANLEMGIVVQIQSQEPKILHIGMIDNIPFVIQEWDNKFAIPWQEKRRVLNQSMAQSNSYYWHCCTIESY